MENFNWRQKLKLVLFSFKVIGLWPSNPKTYATNFYTLYATLSFILFGFGHTFVQMIQVILSPFDLEALAGTLFIACQTMAVMKAYGFMKQIKIMKDLMSKLNNDTFRSRNVTQEVTLNSNLKFWWNLYVGYEFVTYSTVLLWLSFPILDKSYKNSRLPCAAWYPYDFRKTPFYEITYFYQILSLCYLNVCNTNMDMLSVCLMVYIGAQCDILCDNLRSLGKCDEESRSEVFNRELVEIIEHHKEILKFVKNFNRFVDKILLAQFLASLLSLALAFFQITLIAPLTSEFLTVVSLITSTIFQIFLYCWYGNEVDIKSRKIFYAIFESEWIGVPPKAQQNLLIFSLRTRQQITIRTFKLFPLSLGTFMTIMRSAWSYFAVLRQVNIPQE
ncbi:hypothetical protein Zmor_007680 [Zophobas morio]|uniref:Odorant receptor n=1 Tax=Zophobas morio TaxID=2755281 RepID=A0AA38IZM5_9CUCU|nr:hypothetical protein Zmor_007680 [Zophobas morio]